MRVVFRRKMRDQRPRARWRPRHYDGDRDYDGDGDRDYDIANAVWVDPKDANGEDAPGTLAMTNCTRDPLARVIRRLRILPAVATAVLAGCSAGAAKVERSVSASSKSALPPASTSPSAGASAGATPPAELAEAAMPSCPTAAPTPQGRAEQPSFLVQGANGRPLTQVRLSGDGRIMASAGIDGTVLVWDTSMGLLLKRSLATNFALKLSIDNAGGMLAYYAPEIGPKGGIDSLPISTIDLGTGAAPRPITLGAGEFQVSPDGKTIAIGVLGVDLYATRSGAKLGSVDLNLKNAIINGIAFDPAGKRIAVTVAGEVVVLDAPSLKVAQRFPQPGYTGPGDTVYNVAFSGDSLVLKTALWAVHVIDSKTGTLRRTLPGTFYDVAVAGNRLWAAYEAKTSTGALPGKRLEPHLAAFELSTGTEIPVPSDHPRPVNQVAASADGSTIAVISTDPVEGNLIVIHDVKTMRPMRTFEARSNQLTALAVRPDGGQLVTGAISGAFARWDLSTGVMDQAPQQKQARDNYIVAATYDGAGAMFASTSNEVWLRVRDAASGKLVRRWNGHDGRSATYGTFLPGTTDLLTVAWKSDYEKKPTAFESTVKRWDLSGPLPPPPPARGPSPAEFGKPKGRDLATLDFAVMHGALSPDGKSVVLHNGSPGLPMSGDDPMTIKNRFLARLAMLDVHAGAIRWKTTVPTENQNRWVGFVPGGPSVLLSGFVLLPNASKAPTHTPALWVLDAKTGAVEQTLYPGTAGPIAWRGDTVAIGGKRPALLDGKTFAVRARFPGTDMEVTAIAPHPKRNLFIAAGDAGSTSLIAADTGKVTAVLVATAGGEYITTTPEGAFVASLDGARSIAWTYNSPLEAFAFEQFGTEFDRPDIVRRRLAGDNAPAPALLGRPPSLRLDAAPVRTVDSASVPLRASVSSAGRVERVRVYVNGRPAVDKLVCAPSAQVDIDVPLQAGHNRLSVLAYDAAGYASNPQKIDVLSNVRKAARPELWTFSFGVSKYKNLPPEQQLDFADDDARSIAAAFAEQTGQGRPFSKLHEVTLLDEQVTVDSVERSLATLSAMAPDDLAVVFLAGHGVRLNDGKMVYLTNAAALTAQSAKANGVGWDRIEGALRRAKGRVLMLLDACHSGHVSTDVVVPNEALAAQLAKGGRAGVLVFAAARGAQLSYEVPPKGSSSAGSRGLELAWTGGPPAPPAVTTELGGGHGLFTSAVLEALSGAAPDRDRSGGIEVGEFVDYVTERVRSASNGNQTPWVARREMFGDFVIAVPKR